MLKINVPLVLDLISQRDLSTADICLRGGIDYRAFNRALEKGKLRMQSVCRLAKLLGVRPIDLLVTVS